MSLRDRIIAQPQASCHDQPQDGARRLAVVTRANFILVPTSDNRTFTLMYVPHRTDRQKLLDYCHFMLLPVPVGVTDVSTFQAWSSLIKIRSSRP